MTTRRSIIVWTLVVLATLIALFSALTLWVQRQMLDNNAWKNATAQTIADPQVQSALSVYLVNQFYDNVDVAAALRQRLPDNLQSLAAPAAAALREPATKAAQFMFTRPKIQQAFINASAVAHQKLINVLENKTGYGISTGNGVVTLDLSALVTQLGQDVGISQSALAKIPPNAGQITLMKSSQLSAAQTAVRTINALSGWLLALVLAMYALAVYLARGRRRVILRAIAWGFICVGILILVVRKAGGNYVVSALTNPSYQGTVHHVWLIGTSILHDIGWAMILYGVIGLFAVWLAGPTRFGVAARGAITPVLNERQGMAWGALGLVYLLLILWGPTHALRTWWGVLLIGALLATGLLALRQQTLVEAAADELPADQAPPEKDESPPGKPVLR